MDLSSLLGTLLSSESVTTASKSTKTSSSDVQNVVSLAIPLLLNGIDKQAKDEKTSTSLINALSDHGKKDVSNIGSFLGNIDLEDGAKIIGHLLGSNKETVAKDISKKSGVDLATVLELLATYAPLIMTLIGKDTVKAETPKSTSSKSSTSKSTSSKSSSSKPSTSKSSTSKSSSATSSSSKSSSGKSSSSKSASSKSSSSKSKSSASKSSTTESSAGSAASELVGQLLVELLKNKK